MGGRYAGMRGGQRPDLLDPTGRPYKFRSDWEILVAYVLTRAKAEGRLLDWRYEYDSWDFAGLGTGTNSHIGPDFSVWTLRDGHIHEWWIEVKGALPKGGRLTRIDLTTIDDHDSRVKASHLLKSRRYKQRYPRHIWYIGAWEYRWLARRYGSRIPWYLESHTPKRRAPRAA